MTIPATWRRGVLRSQVWAALPGIGAALLPVKACAICWPVYAGVLSTLGLGFLLAGDYLLPMTGGLLFVAALALAYRAKQRRGYGPFLLGVTSSVLILAFKFVHTDDLLAGAGLAGLIGATVWNAWPRSNTQMAGTCATCVPQMPVSNRLNAQQGD